MDRLKTILERLTILLNKAMILYMKHNITYRGIYRGMGKNKKLVFDLTEKITKVRVENFRPVYEKVVMRSTEYINPEDLLTFELDKKRSTEPNAGGSCALQGEGQKVPAAYAQHPPGNAAYAQHPSGNAAYAQHPPGNAAYAQHPSGNAAYAQHPPGNPAQPQSCVAPGWVYQPVNLNGQLVFFPQLYQNVPYMYYPPLKPAFQVNIQPIQAGLPNIGHPPSEPAIQINNQSLHDQEQHLSSHLLNKNPYNLINQATNDNYDQELDISPTILHTYSIAQLMAGIVPGAENLFPKYESNLQKQSDEEFEFEPTVGVLPLTRPKQEPSVNNGKNSFQNEINPVKINNVPTQCKPGGSGNTQNKTDLQIDYLSVPYSLIDSDRSNTGFEPTEIKYTILKREKHKPFLPPLKVPSRSPAETDFNQMSSKDFELHMSQSLGQEFMSLLK